MNVFLEQRFGPGTLDVFFLRRAILRALITARPMLRGTLLDVGCGEKPYRQLLESSNGPVTRYVGLDLGHNPIYGVRAKPDLEWDGKTIPCGESSFDCAMATEVLEHCLHPRLVLAEVFRVLKPGGVFFFTVPFLWPLHDVPYDHYRYTPFALEHMLHEAGFTKIELAALGGWDGALCQMIGLWVRRRPMSRFLRRILSILALPACSLLASRDKLPVSFGESQMLTGISGLAWRD